MTYILLILLIGTLALLYIVFQKLQKLEAGKPAEQQLFHMLQNQIQDQGRSVQQLTQVIDHKLSEQDKNMNQTQQHLYRTMQEQFAQSTKLIQGISGQSNKMIADITEKLTSVDKTNKQVMNFSEQLSNLEKTLTSQKKRGNLGEAGLRLVLENMLPPTAFEMQHHFDDGDIVDALIMTREGSIPVDAKFPLENYQRLLDTPNEEERAALEKDFKNDLKKRIDETSKYIKPKAGTLDFAFMFIPAEGIYYDLLVNEVGTVRVNARSLIDYAFKEKKVIIVSPTTFAAYLQTVLQGLRALKIEESAKSIRKNVQTLQKHLKVYETFMQKLGNGLSTTVNHYNTAYRELGKIDKDIVRITGGQREIEPVALEKPTIET